MKSVGIVPAAALLLLGSACANAQQGGAETAPPGGGQIVTQPVVPLACQPSPRMPLADRQSPYDSATVRVGDELLKVCYGRPSARGREIFGGLVPYGQLWRTGANEPTVLHLPFTADVAGLTVPPGSYSVYTEPGEGEWVVILNRSTSQWGHESSYTPEIRAQEVGRAAVRTERLDQHVETFTIRGEPSGGGADIVLEWERTRVRIPVRVLAASG
jgi:hypothetical protein